jgi:molybdopterin converting factor small subunit
LVQKQDKDINLLRAETGKKDEELSAMNSQLRAKVEDFEKKFKEQEKLLS